MKICHLFPKIKLRCFGFEDDNHESCVKQETKAPPSLMSEAGITKKSPETKFETVDFQSDDSNLNPRFYSIDSQQRRQSRQSRKLNTNLSLSFSGSHSSKYKTSKDKIICSEPHQNDHFKNHWSYLNDKRSEKLSEIINKRKFENSNSSFTIDGFQYSNISIDDFRKVNELGSGNFGHVQHFLHLKSGHHLAIKRMKYCFNFDNNNENIENNRKHIINELELLSKSNHENIVKFYGYIICNNDTELWLCMELMDCCFDRLLYHTGDSPVFIPELIIGSLTISIVNALIYLKHQHQMIHRDIKPSNILINRNGQIKLCDFGISGLLINSISSSRTMGSIAYQAPERIQPPTIDKVDCKEIDFHYDCRVDVWSLGLTLLEMALGHHPYGTWNAAFEIITKIMNPNEVPTLMKPYCGKYSKNLKNFIDYCLQHDYRKRPKYDQIKSSKFYQEQLKKFNTKVVCDWFNSVYNNNNNDNNNIHDNKF